MAGGKGGSQSVKVPKWVEEAGQRNLARANEIAQLGPVEYRGPDVAAFTPMQQAAFANTGAAAQAYGLSGGGMTGMEGMPVAQQMAGGGYGYSAAPIYDAALAELQATAPGQYDFIRNMFIDRVTGARPLAPFGTEAAMVAAGGGAGGGAGGVPVYEREGRDMNFTPNYGPGIDGYAALDALGRTFGGSNFGFGGMGPTGIFG